VIGVAVLAGVALAGAWLGWLVAGRTLHPLTRIAATARRVAGGTLKERIALGGPRDELRELADTFDDMLARLETAFDHQRRFVANASHELRTPLAINRTMVEVAMNDPAASVELRRLGVNLLTVNARQEMLIERLLTLARAELAVVDPVAVDLAQVAREVTVATARTADQAVVCVDVDLVTASTLGDPILLERLVQNLVENAVRYNEPGGWVRMLVGPVGDDVRLTVTNTGPVVCADDAPGLFEPFRRLGGRIGSAQGSGLGLSIVRTVARAHGGEATAVPRSGGGLRVCVVLPRYRAGTGPGMWSS
jgi:signal transduction histidine kinase